MKTEQEIAEALEAVVDLFNGIPKRNKDCYLGHLNTISLVLEEYRDVKIKQSSGIGE